MPNQEVKSATKRSDNISTLSHMYTGWQGLRGGTRCTSNTGPGS